jgi:hypothetical protein
VFTTIISIAARATTQRPLAGRSVGHDPDRDGAVRERPAVAPTLATTMSPLVLDGYPAVMRQTIRSENFALLLPPAEASARGAVSGPPGSGEQLVWSRPLVPPAG